MNHNCTEKFCSQSDRINALQEMFSQHTEGQSKLNDKLRSRISELESLLDDRNRQRNDLAAKLDEMSKVVADLESKILYRDKQVAALRKEVESYEANERSDARQREELAGRLIKISRELQ